MANYTKSRGSLEPSEEWTNFPQNDVSSCATLLFSEFNQGSAPTPAKTAIDPTCKNLPLPSHSPVIFIH
jgi:hypothetical protein